jgi:hypothetical protein
LAHRESDLRSRLTGAKIGWDVSSDRVEGDIMQHKDNPIHVANTFVLAKPFPPIKYFSHERLAVKSSVEAIQNVGANDGAAIMRD